MTETSTILSAAQIEELRQMYDARKGQNSVVEGFWTPVYEKLYSFITDNYDPIGSFQFGIDLNPRFDAPKANVDHKTWLWLRGARYINAGAGPFAALIRNYTIIQHRLRYGHDATPDQMNGASNSIGENFLGQWLGYNRLDPNAPPAGGTQPNITEAGIYDAGPAAAKVFNEETPEGDAAGWAGTLLFGNLGDPEFWRGLVLTSLQNPSEKGFVSGLPSTQDVGSYNAVAATAAIQEWSALSAVPGGFRHVFEVLATILGQLQYGDIVDGLINETDTAFKELYGLSGDDPNPRIGSDTFGALSTLFNTGKDAHYTVGTNGDDEIGYSRYGTNGAFATDTGFFQTILALTGYGEAGDVINAGRGDDKIFGTTGSDILDGGVGSNKLVYLPASWSGLLDRLNFKFDAKGKFGSRTVVDKWSLGGALSSQDRDIAVEFDKLIIDYGSNQLPNSLNPSGWMEVHDKTNAPQIEVNLTGAARSENGVLKRSEYVTLTGDLHRTRGANVYIDLGDSTAVAYNQDVVDASAVTHGVRIDLRDGRIRATDQWDVSAASKIYVTNANQAVGTRFDDELIASSGKRADDAHGNPLAGEGFSALYGGEGNDFLGGAGWESHLYGGAGADTFLVGANSWIEDAEIGKHDTVQNIGIELHGGVNQWWMESGYAYWAPMTTLLTVFPTVGAELLYTAAFFIDTPTMKFVRYRLDADNTLEMNFGWGQAGKAALRNYSIELDSGLGTGSIAVFTAGHGAVDKIHGTSPSTHLSRFVNLALKAGFGVGFGTWDPLVLDLNGDGYQLTTETNSNVWFDFFQNGFAQHSGWVKGDDGFLVRDANGNGKIDNLSEMFGNASQGGFDMLADYDSNLDGAITVADDIYASLKVWQDKDQDGLTDAGELKSLAELGIVSINLASTAPAQATSVGGNVISREGSFTLGTGVTRHIADVAFDVSPVNTHYLGDTTVSAEAAALPQLTGFGTVKDLRVAMTQNGDLKNLVAAFKASTTNDLALFKEAAESILYQWAGVDDVAPTAIGPHGFDARKLAFLENYAGTTLMPRNSSGQLLLDNIGEMEQLWNDQVTRLTLRLIVQGPMASTFAGVTYRADLDLLVANGPTSLGDILHRLLLTLPANASAASAEWAAWAPLLGAFTESMNRSDGAVVRVDYLFEQLVRAADGVAQPLTLAQLAAGLSIANLKLGSAGVDTLGRTTTGDTSVYYGGGGNDVFNGGTGQDVYVFGHSVGNVVINDVEAREGGDRIRFAFLNSGDVALARDGNDLIVTVKETGETIRVTGQFAPVQAISSDVLLSSNKGIEDIQFADGTIWETPEIMTAVGTGTDGNDHMIGTMHSDVLTGGKGNDLLEGGDDADLYVINAGDGQDVISDVQSTVLLRAADMVVFGDNLAPEDITISRVGTDGGDLFFTIGTSGQSLLVLGQFAYGVLGYNAKFALNSRIEAFAFRNYADGWSNKDIQQKLIDQASTDDNDTIVGFGDDDTIDGGKGNDTLVGLDGEDLYSWGSGDGNDTIDERALYVDVNVGLGGLSLTANADTIEFKGLNLADLVFARPTAANDLVVTNTITGETLTIHNQFAGFQTGVLGPQWMDRVEWFSFADGSRISWQGVLQIVTTGGDGDDSLWGDLSNDTLSGGRGNDYLSGKGRGDTYKFGFGDGHDTIEDANDYILGQGFVTVDSEPDVLVLGPGITLGDLRYEHVGNDIKIIIGNGGDSILLKDQDAYINTGVFGAISWSRIEQIKFDDGTIWSWQDLQEQVIASQTTVGNDTVRGFTLEDHFAASAGDDVLMGGDSSDTYDFGIGSGHDQVRDEVSNVLYSDEDKMAFGAGITTSNIVLTRDGADLLVSITGESDQLRIVGQFENYVRFTFKQIESFEFADGTVWSAIDVQNRLLQSTPDDDVLSGYYTDDMLEGGLGNDVLRGGDGSDTYVFNRGDGQDRIEESVEFVNIGDDDVLRFGTGIAPTDLVLSRTGNDLIVGIAGTSDQITIAGEWEQYVWFSNNDIERFEFADGSIWTKDEIAARILAGTPGDDLLIGTSGNDRLDGRAGNDRLEGGDGSDTYVFGRGYGQDVIRESVNFVSIGDDDRLIFKEGVSPSDLIYTRDNDDLIVTISGTTDTIRIEGEFSYDAWFTWHDIERFEFADGTIISKDAIRQLVLAGTPGNDTIIGFASDDTLDGGAGNDILIGADGSDTYRFGVGDGHDVIRESLWDGRLSEDDTLSFKTGVAPADVTVTRIGQDAIFTLASGDTIRVEGQFNEGYNEFLSSNDVEHVVFADGTTWDKIEIDRRSIDAAGTVGDDVMLGSRYAQTYNGRGGNDTIYAGDRDDVLIGGEGNDRLEGQAGNDTYLYNAGDGDDVIFDEDYFGNGTNKIVFGAGITAGDLRLSGNPADGTEMTISFANQAGSIRVLSQWVEDIGIDTFEFADGTAWTVAQIATAFASDQTTAGDDVVYGTNFADILAGSTGNDNLVGGGGDDIYRFGRGDGADTIFDRGFGYWWGYADGGNDTVELGPNILPADIDVIETSADDIALRIRGTGDELKLLGEVSDPARRIETIKFADGTVWTFADVLARALQGTSGDDMLYAGSTPSTIAGLAGNDTLTGSQGNDDLDGGTGNDALIGGGGDDIYRFGRGDGADTIFDQGPGHWWGYESGGNDTIELKAGIVAADIDVVQTSPDDMAIRIRDTGDQLTILGNTTDSSRRIETVRFADGTTWTYSDLLALALAPTAANDVHYAGDTPSTVLGGAGDDMLYGSAGADILEGDAGNDVLVGSAGDDTYRFARGDGADTIFDQGPGYWWGYESGGDDTIELAAGITSGDIDVLQISPDDMVIRIRYTGDQLTIFGNTTDSSRRIETVRFADGMTWTYADVLAHALAPTADDDVHYAGDTPSTLLGGAGDDALYGSAGADILEGDAGIDTLVGGAGDDTYRFGRGDGADTIFDQGPGHWWGYESGGNDTIEFAADIVPGDIEVLQTSADDLAFQISGTTDRLIVSGALTDTTRQVENAHFADGTTWDFAQIFAKSLLGTSGNDTLRGNDAANLLIGGAGDDTLTGGAGADVFAYQGGYGQDTITDFTTDGETQDVLRFDQSVFSDWAHLLGATQQVGSDLVITLDPADTITLRNVALTSFSSANATFV